MSLSFEIPFEPTHRRLLALALAIAPLCLFGFAVTTAIQDMIDHHARLAFILRERRTYETLIADLPKRKRAIAALNASGASMQLFPPQQAASVANEVQREVANIVSSAGVPPSQSTVRIYSESSPPATAVSDHVIFVCNIGQLTQIMMRLSQVRPSLFVDHLGIYDEKGEHRDLGPHLLNVDIVVSGYMRL